MNPYIIPGLKYKTSIGQKTIIESVLKNSGLTEEELFSKNRQREVINHRHVCMWGLRRYTGATLQAIADLFGGRDHTTVINACRNVDNLIETNDFQILSIVQRIKNYQSIKTITNEVS